MSSPTSNRRPVRVVFVGARDSGGGAARATYRIFDALWQRREELRLDISMRVIHKTTDHPGIIGGAPQPSTFQRRRTLIIKGWRRLVRRKKFFSPHTIYNSRAEFDTGLGRELLEMNADLYVLNWLGSKTLSIREIGRLGRRAVWLLHDMWAFSGAEHYRFDDRASHGYSRSSRPREETGPDIHRRAFLQKKRHWREPMSAIATTQWLAGEAKKSALARNWNVHTRPYPLDTVFWTPSERATARRYWNIEQNESIVLFGAAGGTKYFHKGSDALFAALPLVRRLLPPSSTLTLAIFGEERNDVFIDGVRTRYLGLLDDEDLREAYSAADIIVVPSLLEAFGQVASEAHACGLPAVVFDRTGLTDIVEDGVTGYHVRNNDIYDLAEKITDLLADDDRRKQFATAARRRAVELWHPDVVAKRHSAILHHIAQQLLTERES